MLAMRLHAQEKVSSVRMRVILQVRILFVLGANGRHNQTGPGFEIGRRNGRLLGAPDLASRALVSSMVDEALL